MKIPAINYNTPVAPLAKQDLGAIVAQSNAKQRLVGQVVAMGAEIYSRVQTQKGLDAFARSTEQLNALEVEMTNRPASDPRDLETEFNSRAGKISREAEKDLSGTSLKVYRDRYGPKRQAQWFGTSMRNATLFRAEQRKATMASVNQLAEVDLPAALQQIDESPMFTDFEKSVGRAEIRTVAARSGIREAEQSGDADKIEAQLEILQTEDVPLSETERHRAIGYLKAARKEAIAKDVADLERARELKFVELSLGVDDGSMGEADVYSAKENGIIKTPEKMVSLLLQVRKKREDSIEDARLSTMLSQALLNGEPLNPRDKDNIKAVNNRYDVAAKRLAEMQGTALQKAQGQEELTRRGMALAKATNILPTNMLGDLRRYAMAGSPAIAAKQATIYEKLQVIAPQALNPLSQKEEAVWVGAGAMIRGGMSPQEAVEKARDNLRLPPEVKAGFDRAYKSEGYGGERLAEAFKSDSRFDIELFGEADPTPQQMGIYAAMERQFYLDNGGDIELAKTAALNKFKRIYSGSTAGTPGHSQKVMAYAPERQYGLTADEVQRDLILFAKRNKIANPKKVYVTSDNLTMRETDKTYRFWVTNRFGLPERPLDTQGVPVRWKPGILKEQELGVLRQAEEREIRKAPGQARAKASRKRITDKIVPDYSQGTTSKAKAKAQGQARVLERKRAVEAGRKQAKERSGFLPNF